MGSGVLVEDARSGGGVVTMVRVAWWLLTGYGVRVARFYPCFEP